MASVWKRRRNRKKKYFFIIVYFLRNGDKDYLNAILDLHTNDENQKKKGKKDFSKKAPQFYVYVAIVQWTFWIKHIKNQFINVNIKNITTYACLFNNLLT